MFEFLSNLKWFLNSWEYDETRMKYRKILNKSTDILEMLTTEFQRKEKSIKTVIKKFATVNEQVCSYLIFGKSLDKLL